MENLFGEQLEPERKGKQPAHIWGKGLIKLDTQTWQWEGITDDDKSLWTLAYPAVDIKRELAKAAAWQKQHPTRKKSNYGRFLNSWMARAQDQSTRDGKQGEEIKRVVRQQHEQQWNRRNAEREAIEKKQQENLARIKALPEEELKDLIERAKKSMPKWAADQVTMWRPEVSPTLRAWVLRELDRETQEGNP